MGNGTVYVLSNIRGANAPAALLGNYLKTYRNGLFEPVKIPNTYGAANMTATDDVVVVVEELSVHWSCDAGKTWTKEAHNYSQQSNRNGLLFAAGNVHVMNEVGSDGVVHAFFSHAYKDDPNDANEDPLTQIIHMEFDVSNLCAP